MPIDSLSELLPALASFLDPVLSPIGTALTSLLGHDSALSSAPHLLPLLLVAAFLAGLVDAIVGGGGLIQLPALMLMPGLAPVTALATNKLAGLAGTASAALAYGRRTRFQVRTAAPAVVLAFLGALAGAHLATRVPSSTFTPIVIAALCVVLVITLTRPRLFSSVRRALPGRSFLRRILPTSALIGVYDGFIGPGTGSFLLMALIGAGRMPVLAATSLSKLVNAATNLGALLLFSGQGVLDWRLGLVMAAANVAGAQTGARWAIRVGAGLIRGVLIVVVLALILVLVRRSFA